MLGAAITTILLRADDTPLRPSAAVESGRAISPAESHAEPEALVTAPPGQRGVRSAPQPCAAPFSAMRMCWAHVAFSFESIDSTLLTSSGKADSASYGGERVR